MISVEEIYAMEHYLNNLLMFKYLYDEGIDLKPFADTRLHEWSDFGVSFHQAFENFAAVTNHLFEIVDILSAYGDENIDDKMYWLKLVHYDCRYIESLEVIVILDPSLGCAFTGPVTGNLLSSDNVSEIYQIDDGVVIVCEYDYGEPDFTEIMYALLASRSKVLNTEVPKYEVAI